MELSRPIKSSTSRDFAKTGLQIWFEAVSRASPEPIPSPEFVHAGLMLFHWTGDKKWADNPKLYFILRKIGREDLFPKWLAAHVTDFWIPFTKPMTKRLLEEEHDRKRILDAQRRCLDEDNPPDLDGRHFSLEDSDSLELEEVTRLGAGGYGEVHHVKHLRTGKAYAQKTMARGGNFQRQCEMMKSFKREVTGMRRVRHRHCVDLIATCTDAGSVVLLCSPVADMDLAAYLDQELSITQLDILRQAVGCVTSALAYLHEENIRHDDLKPNNILIHGSNILLTDFGFCLDFSDAAGSTTAGAPTHFSQRYSAPEVFGREPRNRLTDIWGLGCVLIEILSRLRGYKLSILQSFWQSNGIQYNSFAENPEATKNWIKKLTHTATKTQHGKDRRELWLICFVHNTLLAQDRLLRPTAKQVLGKLQDLDLIYPVETNLCWVAGCCSTATNFSTLSKAFPISVPQWPILDDSLDNHLVHIFFDMNDVYGNIDNLPFPDRVNVSGRKLDRLLPSESDRQLVREAVRLMLSYHPSKSHSDMDVLALLPQINSSALAGCLRDVSFWVASLNVFVDDMDMVPRMRTVQLCLHTICLERQPGFGRPFLFMTFDPGEGEMKYTKVENPKHDPWAHLDPQKLDYEPQTLFYFREESRDVWTDGIVLAALRPDAKQIYASFQSTVSERRRKNSERRTIPQGFRKTKCIRCTQYDLECEGPVAGVCSHCQKALTCCGFDPDVVKDVQLWVEDSVDHAHVEHQLADGVSLSRYET